MRPRIGGFSLALALMATGAFAQNARMGVRYQIIDSEVERVVTRFASGEVTSLRSPDGSVITTLRAGGKVIKNVSQPAQIRLTPKSSSSAAVLTINDRSLDFINADAYVAWRNREPRGAAYRPLSEEAAALLVGQDPVELADAASDLRFITMYTRDYEVLAKRTRPSARIEQPNLPNFTAALRKRDTGELVAIMGWHEDEQTLVFRFMGEEPMAITNTVLPQGRWSFYPNEAWADIQLLSLMKGRNSARLSQRPIVSATSLRPTPLNDPGCDGLHWLDGTVYRQCCDDHDRCYETEWPPCEAGKSWFFMGGWSCTFCNIEVVVCFATVYDIYGKFPIYEFQNYYGDNCYIVWCCECPAWCYGCVWEWP
jgi:hypothetical protein